MRLRCLSLVLTLGFPCLAARPVPQADLPDGYELVLAAAPPLVRHPTMGCVDDRGRLFVGDSAGVNWRPPQLEKELPHRVLLLEDTDRDQVFDRVSIFADRMTFPQGACWLAGSLYVASPPGIWKLTDTDGDGVADQREMIVGGFEYDGNAADVHGPFLHPTNGRLYWCHGRKGHRVVQKDGTPVHEGKASGIWSCRPDGADVQWHALGCMDNPVEVDFTPEGDLLGVVNLYYNQPRGDTLVHWLYGGAYERADQLNVIAGLPRTLDQMPVVFNYGHVAVSGCTLYRSGILHPSWVGDLFVTYFNTQKVVRTKLTPAGATFSATNHEFLKIQDPDVHLTDVIEDRDGSLLILDTGGWFRIGCPASLVEKPDQRGAVYRVRRRAPPTGRPTVLPAKEAGPIPLARVRLHHLETLARSGSATAAERTELLSLLAEPLDRALEHAAMYAAIRTRCFDLDSLRAATAPRLIRRLLRILEQTLPDESAQEIVLQSAKRHVESTDPELAAAAVALVARQARALALSLPEFTTILSAPRLSAGKLSLVSEVLAVNLTQSSARPLLTRMLEHPETAVRQSAWRLLARQPTSAGSGDWIAPLDRSLSTAANGELPLLLDAIARLQSPAFAAGLQRLVSDASRPEPIRLKALAAASRPGQPLRPDAFEFLLALCRGESTPASRVVAARVLTSAKLSDEQLRAVAPLLATVGPLELAELIKIHRRNSRADIGRLWAEHLARSAVFAAIEESAVRSAFSTVPADIYEQVLRPAVRAAADINDAKKRRLETLAAQVGRGRPAEGKNLFATSACLACHTAGGLGRALGPDLSHIGQIRRPRDLLESILFPDATIARDFEAFLIETADGQKHFGTIKSEGQQELIVIDPAGQEKRLAVTDVIARSPSPSSMMPSGLEQGFSEQQLLDLVAWLASLQ